MMKKILLLTALIVSISIGYAQTTFPYQNQNLSNEKRADDLLSRLTLEEKISLMMDISPAIERLQIPEFQWWNEALHGVGRNGIATVFPITMAMAASFNDGLVYEIFNAVSDEARAKNQIAKKSGTINRYQCLSFWTPNINIFRDPRWGRGQETYGEDPYLTSIMGVAVVKGLQGPDDAKYRKTLACAKHFAVHSGPEWNRHSFNIENLPLRDLYETYLPAFKALIQEANVEEVMCAYQRMDGKPCCGNNNYLHHILREQLGFKGFVTSDCWALNDFYAKDGHNIVANDREASAMALRAGTDVECGPNFETLNDAVKRNEVTVNEIDNALRKLLIARFKLGDFDNDNLVEWTKIPESVIANNEHRDLALKIARQSIVMLQNKNNILPLNKSQKIIVIGPNANDSVMLWGNYNGTPKHTITILEGIKKEIPNVEFFQGCDLTTDTITYSRFSAINNGLTATYWNNENLEGQPIVTKKYQAPLNLQNGGATVFEPGVNLEHFSARFTGEYISQNDETLNFNVKADDAVKLIVNGKTLIDNWNNNGKIAEFSEQIAVKKGEKLAIELQYKQIDNYALLNFDINVKIKTTVNEILAKTQDADIVIFAGGISPKLEGEEMDVDAPGFRGGDRTNIEVPEVQRNIMQKLHENGKKVVFLDCSGGAMGLEPETKNCDAILQVWYLGEKGGQAIADVLFGNTNPSGKLPVTFYKNVNQIPDFLDYTMKNRTYRYMTEKPLFEFGYGLSYSDFKISKVKYANKKITYQIKNNSNRDGEEVVQVYIRKIGDIEGPNKTLRAVQRINVPAGKTVKSEINLKDNTFEWWDKSTNTMRVLSGEYEIMVGNSSSNTISTKAIISK